MNRFLSAVNQKRLFADLLLQQAYTADGRHLQLALVQGAVAHLHQALEFYCGEIAATYQCRQPELAVDTKTLVDQLNAVGKQPGEAQELQTLAQDRSSWYCQVHDCQQFFTTVAEPAENRQDENLIAVASGREDWRLVSIRQVADWLAAFNAMLERQRETMVEF